MAAVVDQQFLDSQQYKKTGILRYEAIFGNGYISTGGEESTKKIFNQYFDKSILNKNPRILDVGCGIGGGDIFLVDQIPGARVVGVDLSSNCIDICKERYSNTKYADSVEFLLKDALEDEIEGKFDMIYSRDSILHISDKKRLFNRFYELLNPGGVVLLTDYAAAEKSTWDQEFSEYVAQRNYTLTTVEEYDSLLQNAGLSRVNAVDATNWFTEILQNESDNVEKNKESLLNFIDKSDLEELLSGWKRKIDRTSRGIQRWGIFVFKKDS